MLGNLSNKETVMVLPHADGKENSQRILISWMSERIILSIVSPVWATQAKSWIVVVLHVRIIRYGWEMV